MDFSFGSIAFALAAAAAWGTGDFLGGWSTRRAPVLVVMWFSQVMGLSMLVLLTLARGESGLTTSDILWAVIASLTGMTGIASLYQAMASGQMSIAAPITAVLAAGIPVLFSAITESLPGGLTLMGFVLALAGIWLISSLQQTTTVQLKGIGLALLGGTGFGIFFICMGQFSDHLVFLPQVVVRSVSLTIISLLLLTTRRFQMPSRNLLPVILVSGIADTGGNVFFVLAEQAGRLDITSVLSSLYPVVTVMLALILLRERLNRPQVAGVLLVFVAIPLIAAG